MKECYLIQSIFVRWSRECIGINIFTCKANYHLFSFQQELDEVYLNVSTIMSEALQRGSELLYTKVIIKDYMKSSNAIFQRWQQTRGTNGKWQWSPSYYAMHAQYLFFLRVLLLGRPCKHFNELHETMSYIMCFTLFICV